MHPMPRTVRGVVAVVTGGGSGIGAAVVAELAARGARVVAADLDLVAAEAVAAAHPGVDGRWLDVTDADAFAALVAEVGPVDVLVNNAGIGAGGETQELALEHWERVLDVNVRGCVHGVVAVYPQMVARGSGSIVNVASLAGLLPAPLLTPYAMSKHAVVGLSLSLRAEAARYGVGVTVVCPAAVDTPLLDHTAPPGLTATASSARLDLRRFLTRDLGPAMTPPALARAVVDGIERNRAMVVEPRRARAAWRLLRVFPGLALRVQRRAADRERRTGRLPA